MNPSIQIVGKGPASIPPLKRESFASISDAYVCGYSDQIDSHSSDIVNTASFSFHDNHHISLNSLLTFMFHIHSDALRAILVM